MAAKIAVARTESAERVARHIDETEQRIREAVPIARVIYIEPDIYDATAANRASEEGAVQAGGAELPA